MRSTPALTRYRASTGCERTRPSTAGFPIGPSSAPSPQCTRTSRYSSWRPQTSPGSQPTASLSHPLTWPPAGMPPATVGSTLPTEDATASIGDELVVLYSLTTGGAWQRFVPARPDVSTLAELHPLDAVLLLATGPSDAVWTFPQDGSFVWPDWARQARIAGAFFEPSDSEEDIEGALDDLASQGVSVVLADSPWGSSYAASVDDAEFFAVKELVTTVVQKAHERGLKVVLYQTGLELISDEGRNPGSEHPDWPQISLDGQPILFDDISSEQEHWLDEGQWDIWLSPCSSYRQLSLARVQEMASAGIDGLWVDTVYLQHSIGDHEDLWPSTDTCSAAAFQSATGLSVPTRGGLGGSCLAALDRLAARADVRLPARSEAGCPRGQRRPRLLRGELERGRNRRHALRQRSGRLPGLPRHEHGPRGRHDRRPDGRRRDRHAGRHARPVAGLRDDGQVGARRRRRQAVLDPDLRLSGRATPNVWRGSSWPRAPTTTRRAAPAWHDSVGADYRRRIFSWTAAHEDALYGGESAATVALAYSPRTRDLLDQGAGDLYEPEDAPFFREYRQAAATLAAQPHPVRHRHPGRRPVRRPAWPATARSSCPTSLP